MKFSTLLRVLSGTAAIAGMVLGLVSCGGNTSPGPGNSGGGAAGGSGGNGGSPGDTVGPNGGSVSSLLFTVVGDTRPPAPDDTQGYPTAIIDKLYEDIAAMNPPSQFSIATGDYMFASSWGGGQASPQLDLYVAARQKYSGTFFPAMGNHECTGGTASNCGQGNTDGLTDNYNQFMSKMLGPIGQKKPYYSFNVTANDNSWTAKFVFIAANAWDSGQASWLQSAMSPQTTYTFVIRHESSYATDAPGVSPSEQIINQFPYTLEINGHTHRYEHYQGDHNVIIGNGGAPLSGSGNYGYGVFAQRADGAIVVDMMDYQTNKADTSFHFVVKADGSPTQ